MSEREKRVSNRMILFGFGMWSLEELKREELDWIGDVIHEESTSA